MKTISRLIFSIWAIVALSFSLLPESRAQGMVRYVKQEASGKGDGSSWANASSDLQAMIVASRSGDEVWVAQGTYHPSKLIKSTKKRSFAFLLKNGVSLYGGFEGLETNKDERKKKNESAPRLFSFVHASILDADIDDMEDDWIRRMGDGSSVRYEWDIMGNEKNANHILYSDKSTTITDPIVIDGFTLQGGYADVWSVEAAGAALHAKGNVALRNSIIRRNAAYTRVEADKLYQGGAVYLDGKNASIDNCLFEDNYASMPTLRSYGGSVFMNGGKIENSLFRGSVSLDEGGAIAIMGGSVTNCHFYDCYAAVGGAISMNGSSIEKCFIAHSRSLKGGAISAVGGSIHHTSITNCYSDDPSFGDAGYGLGGGVYALDKCQIVGSIITHCTAGQGGGVYLGAGSQLYHSTLYANTQRKAKENPNLFLGESAISKNNIEEMDVASNQFVKAVKSQGFSEESKLQDRKDAEEADYALAPGSRFIASGEVVPEVNESKDMRGVPRINSAGKIDRGALAYQGGETPNLDVPTPNITLTFRDANRKVKIGAGGQKGTKFKIDFGNGKLVEYEDAKVIEETILSNTVKLYGDDIMILLVNNQGLESIDLSGASQLMKLQLIGNYLKKIDLTHSPKLYQIYCEQNEIEQPLDFSAQSRMNVISIQRNKISGTLDLGHIRGLTSLLCYNNQLTEVKLPNEASVLTSVVCDSNSLEVLDLSKCMALEELSCADNKIAKLDLKNNPKLTKIYAINNCITDIDVSKNKALETLTLTNNQISSINLSNNTELKNLYLGSNKLSTLDISQNTNIEYLVLDKNHLKEIQTQNQKKLRLLKVSDNRLSSLDIKENKLLFTLWFAGNEISQIDLSNQSSLIWLVCDNNRLSDLSLTSNANISWLECGNNQLKTLNLTAQKNLQKLFSQGNQIQSIQWGNKSNLQGIRVDKNQLNEAELNAILSTLPDVSKVELNDNNKDWARKIDISDNPGTLQANTSPATAQGWTVNATVGIESVSAAILTFYYNQESDLLVLPPESQWLKIYDSAGLLLAEYRVSGGEVSLRDLPSGVPYIAVVLDSRNQKNVCTFTK